MASSLSPFLSLNPHNTAYESQADVVSHLYCYCLWNVNDAKCGVEDIFIPLCNNIARRKRCRLNIVLLSLTLHQCGPSSNGRYKISAGMLKPPNSSHNMGRMQWYYTQTPLMDTVDRNGALKPLLYTPGCSCYHLIFKEEQYTSIQIDSANIYLPNLKCKKGTSQGIKGKTCHLEWWHLHRTWHNIQPLAQDSNHLLHPPSFFKDRNRGGSTRP